MPDEDVYRRSLQRIIDDQIELEDEATAREQAEAADIELDEDNNVVDWEGDGDEAINRLRYEITGKKVEEPEETSEDDDETEDDGEGRQEYYLDTIRGIVEEQKEFLGEDVAIKQARQAPLIIDADGNVEGFYGKGEDALEILRGFTEHQEFYLEAIQRTVDAVASFFGDKVALKYARQAPLEITPDGDVKAYYGKGLKSLKILLDNYEDYMGGSVADAQIRSAMEDLPEERQDLLPERIRPGQGGKQGGLVEKIRTMLGV
ncbi:MAG: hypothetical protein SVU32_02890 [Candidatus Nanohaloarchaea archaeon]|nr:hypothetical protein [Candidatus Nanohaloarchaea archaeon]